MLSIIILNELTKDDEGKNVLQHPFRAPSVLAENEQIVRIEKKLIVENAERAVKLKRYMVGELGLKGY